MSDGTFSVDRDPRDVAALELVRQLEAAEARVREAEARADRARFSQDASEVEHIGIEQGLRARVSELETALTALVEACELWAGEDGSQPLVPRRVANALEPARSLSLSSGTGTVIASTRNHRGSAVDICRENGWTVGTRLVGDEGDGPTVIEITGFGESFLFAKALGHRGVAQKPYEQLWVLSCRDWREARDDEIPVALTPGQVARLEGCDLVGVVLDGPDSGGCYRVDCGDDGIWCARAHREPA